MLTPSARLRVLLYVLPQPTCVPDDQCCALAGSFRVTMWDMGRVAWVLILQDIADMSAQGNSDAKAEL